MSEAKRFKRYLEFVYLQGGLVDDVQLSETDAASIAPLLRRNRYFIDGGIIGSKDFVMRLYGKFNEYFSSKSERKFQGVTGINGVYSLKRLSDKL